VTALTDILAISERAPSKRRYGKSVKGGPSERTIQREIVKAVRALGIIVHHSPNGAMLGGDKWARVKQAAVLKADGNVPGWPDLTLLNRAGEVGFMEVKAPGGTLEPSQEALIPKLEARTYRVAVVTSVDEALGTLRGWGWL
jgi:hypothetical protein